jgi:hypothetical protein
MAAKALAWLFFVLTLLNIPVFMCYWSAAADTAAVSVTTTTTNSTYSNLENDIGLAGYFSRLSLGNIGQTTAAGGEANYLAVEVLTISCPSGTLDSLNAFGLARDDEANARLIADASAPTGLLDASCALVATDGSTTEASL